MSHPDYPTFSALSQKCLTLPKELKDQLIRKSALLYALMTHPDSPPWVKAIVIAALLYFLLPFDTIPDVLPVLGFTDDLAVITAAVAKVKDASTIPSVQQRAEEVASQFGSSH